MRSCKPALLLLSCLMLSQGWAADMPAQNLGSSYNTDFLHYKPYVTRGKPTASAPVPLAAKPESSASQATAVNVEWLRKNYPMILDRAINKPTPENAAAYLYATRLILDYSNNFTNAVQQALNTHPLLNENNRIPIASLGAQSEVRANLNAQEAAVRQLAQSGGLLVFVDSNCRFCAMQLPIVDAVRRDYGMDALVISVDGRNLPGYRGQLVKDNGLWSKLQLKLTPSIVFVNKPRAYQGDDPNKYLVISQGFYAANDLVKQIAYAGFREKLLDEPTTRALDVWNLGVMKSQDLQQLKLDPNDPAAFRRTLDPLLLKQYR